MARIQLLGIAGSLRAGSFSTAILESLREELSTGVDLHLHPLADVPLYNQDPDTDIPLAPVAALRDAIAGADGWRWHLGSMNCRCWKSTTGHHASTRSRRGDQRCPVMHGV